MPRNAKKILVTTETFETVVIKVVPNRHELDQVIDGSKPLIQTLLETYTDGSVWPWKDVDSDQVNT
jgi:hypothetical protein